MDRVNVYAKTPVNKNEIPQEFLDIENKVRSNLLRWNGQFSPQLIEALLQKYARQDSTIFDPFVGSGTVLYEAGCLGLKAYGSEINPAAFYLSQTYECINKTVSEREHVLEELEKKIFHKSNSGVANGNLKNVLVNIYKESSSIDHKNILESFITLLDFYQNDVNFLTVSSKWQKLKSHYISLPCSQKKIKAFNCDARKTSIKESEVDLVITSPPYINVFNYHQQYRASVESLNWNCLIVAQSEFGSNRKNRGNRFLTVIQYILDIAGTLFELSRVCKKDARIIFIVGRESNVRGTRFFNGEIVANLGNILGLGLILRQERSFRNRFGERIFEDLIHFKNNKLFNYSEIDLRKLSQKVLEDSLKIAPIASKDDIVQALKLVHIIKPSPYFISTNALKECHEIPVPSWR